ncbi:MAG: GNAT family protein [Steroidobacteraceae bacterium]
MPDKPCQRLDGGSPALPVDDGQLCSHAGFDATEDKVGHLFRMNTGACFPEVLMTSRLSLRRYRAQDTESVRTLVSENRDHLMISFPEMARGMLDAVEVAAFIDQKSALWNAGKTFCYGIWREDSKALIGQIQAKNILWNVPSAELSYFIATSSLRRGYASEAIERLLRTALDDFSLVRIHIRVIASNAASLALAERLGFSAEGLHRQEFRCGHGRLHDIQHLSIVKSLGEAPAAVAPTS